MKAQAANPGSVAKPGLRFDRMEWAGAFGDLGTLIPFVVAYLTLLKMDPSGVLLAFGLALIGSGLYYRTPVPVQPMKAIGAIATTQAAQTLALTPNAVYGAGLITGLVWLALGASGLARHVARLVGRPVALGIVLGLGLSFMLEGIRMMASGWLLGLIALIGTLTLLPNRVFPAMGLLLVFGAIAAIVQQPALLDQLAGIRVGFRLPSWPLGALTRNDLVLGAVFLALPQVPLTLGNAVIAITEENNRLFPERPVSEQQIALSTGVMNIAGALLGGVPMCHGAGGMAGHVRFGAHTGGAPVILGTILVTVALFFSASVETLLKMFPRPVLGVILFLAGAELALGARQEGLDKGSRFVLYTVAAAALWNVGVAFLWGVLAQFLIRRGVIRI